MFKTYLPIRWCGQIPIITVTGEKEFSRIILLNVEFDETFGPFKRGETVSCLEVDFVEGWIKEFVSLKDDRETAGSLLRSCEFIGIPERRSERRRQDDVDRRRSRQNGEES